ncbi:FAD-dependent thymidylate synthase, partial [Aliarcobacter butzleri]
MIQLINKKENIFGDNIAFVENWDFSKANLNEENRILAITQVASICYQNPNALGSESLYNRLAAESKGLPSSSFEFVPVLLDPTNEKHKEILALEYSNVKKFGELICDGKYLLTNYRALVYDFENNENAYSFDIRTIYNTEIECEIIKQYFKVFLYKVDFPTRSQMVRHRVNWQELSRRYVSGKRVPFEFYISEKLQNNPKVEALIKQSEELYFELLENGVKP